MPELIGQTLSHYRITAALGAGGMGEVYRATDSNLGRDVAIKVLPPEVAQDADRLSRFRREAQLLAALNHPNIAAIYGLEEAHGKPFLALELVEGEDLKQRLARGAIPVDETLEIAEQIALALEEAHNKGIVHRDLKPANVKLTPDGKVKVLDFGLAKAWAGEASGVGSAPSALSQSPTLAHTGTIAGVILGTAAYMSPEQARGKPVDKRADVWSFGVLLWEMLTGRSLFAGDTVTDVIAAVVTKEPDLEALPPATPRAMRRLLSRCLRKDPRTRLPDMGAARIEIQDVRAGSAEEPGATAAGSDPTAAGEIRRLARQRWAWAAAFLLAAGLAGYLAASHFTETPEIRPAAHFVIEPPEGRRFIPWGAPAVSRDGRQVAFATAGAEASMPGTLWTRPLESVVSRELPGTEGAMLPFWSPDSRSLAFFTDSELRRISLDSGAAQKVCALPQGRFTAGGDWAEDGTILFSAGGDNARLYTVSASGGEAKLLTALDESRGEMAHWWPRLLPDGRHFLFQVRAKEPERQGLYVASLDEPQARRRLLPALTRADYQAGHLLFVRDETLLAQAFDVKRGSPAGEPSAVAFSVATWSASPGWGWFSTHRGELLAYLEGESRDSELVWFDRKGSRLGAVGKPGNHIALALSPDEKQAAVQAITPGAERSDIWTIDLARGVGTRQTSDTASESSPTWSADGREILFSSNREQTNRVYRKTLQGNEPETPFGKATEAIFPESVSPDGKELLYYARGTSGHTIGVLSLNGDKDPEPILEKPYPLDEPQLSPDGRWLAYGAQEAGRWEVYIEPYRRPGERVRVSPDGGGLPKWRGDGKELFYVTRGGLLMAVEVKASSDRLEVGLPVRLFGGVQGSGTIDTYAVTRDGQRFLAIVPIGAAARGKIHVVTNWTSLLEKR